MGLWNLHFCKNDCGEVFKTYFCKKCNKFITDYCIDCHEEHYNEIDRMKDMSRLKRDFHV